MLNSLRSKLWRIRQQFPAFNNIYQSVRKQKFPIYLEFPVQAVPRYGFSRPRHAGIYEMLLQREAVFRQHLDGFVELQNEFWKIPTASDSAATPIWINGTLPALDAMALYSFLVKNNPRRYLEIGSGNSTRFARQAINTHQLKTEIISIDPQPRVEIDALCDRVIRGSLEDMDLDFFDQLEAGDIIFYDGSHVVFENSDVTVFFLDILPKLRAGIWVQIHDINWPIDYGPEIAGRYFSEQYILAAYLLGGGNGLEIELSNHFVWHDSNLVDTLAETFLHPSMKGVAATGASFWLRTVERKPAMEGRSGRP